MMIIGYGQTKMVRVRVLVLEMNQTARARLAVDDTFSLDDLYAKTLVEWIIPSKMAVGYKPT